MLDLPPLVPVRRRLTGPVEPDPAAAAARELEAVLAARPLPAGARVALAVGSRRIAGVPEVVRAAIELLRARGLAPVLVPAMGSHGGGTAGGQLALLAGLGIDGAAIGCPVVPETDTVELGRAPAGFPVFFARAALQAAAVLVVARVRPHTAFAGRIGSGPLKMLAVGLGKLEGARAVHAAAVRGLGLETAIRQAARLVTDRVAVLGALCLIENAGGELARVVGLRGEELEAGEPELLAEAVRLRPGLPFASLDLLVVDRIGKDISGTGLDPWVIGRLLATGEPEPGAPRIARIFARSLSPASHGNAHGVGLVDFVHRRLAEAVDWEVTRLNAIAAQAPQKARLPLVVASDREGIVAALDCSGAPAPEAARIARILDTAHLAELGVSPAALGEALAEPGAQPAGPPEPLGFDAAGDLTPA